MEKEEKVGTVSRGANRPSGIFTVSVKQANDKTKAVAALSQQAVATDSVVAVRALNVGKMVQDAAQIEWHIANGGKPEELSGIKFFRPSGLLNQ